MRGLKSPEGLKSLDPAAVEVSADGCTRARAQAPAALASQARPAARQGGPLTAVPTPNHQLPAAICKEQTALRGAPGGCDAASAKHPPAGRVQSRAAAFFQRRSAPAATRGHNPHPNPTSGADARRKPTVLVVPRRGAPARRGGGGGSKEDAINGGERGAPASPRSPGCPMQSASAPATPGKVPGARPSPVTAKPYAQVAREAVQPATRPPYNPNPASIGAATPPRRSPPPLPAASAAAAIVFLSTAYGGGGSLPGAGLGLGFPSYGADTPLPSGGSAFELGGPGFLRSTDGGGGGGGSGAPASACFSASPFGFPSLLRSSSADSRRPHELSPFPGMAANRLATLPGPSSPRATLGPLASPPSGPGFGMGLESIWSAGSGTAAGWSPMGGGGQMMALPPWGGVFEQRQTPSVPPSGAGAPTLCAPGQDSRPRASTLSPAAPSFSPQRPYGSQ